MARRMRRMDKLKEKKENEMKMKKRRRKEREERTCKETGHIKNLRKGRCTSECPYEGNRHWTRLNPK